VLYRGHRESPSGRESVKDSHSEEHLTGSVPTPAPTPRAHEGARALTCEDTCAKKYWEPSRRAGSHPRAPNAHGSAQLKIHRSGAAWSLRRLVCEEVNGLGSTSVDAPYGERHTKQIQLSLVEWPITFGCVASGSPNGLGGASIGSGTRRGTRS